MKVNINFENSIYHVNLQILTIGKQTFKGGRIIPRKPFPQKLTNQNLISKCHHHNFHKKRQPMKSLKTVVSAQIKVREIIINKIISINMAVQFSL